MNRLSPLIERRVGPMAGAVSRPAPPSFGGQGPAQWAEDVKLFATGWVGGLVFFGTLLG